MSSFLFWTSVTYYETEDHFLLQCNNEHETQDDNILFVFITATYVFITPPGDMCFGDEWLLVAAEMPV